MKSFTGFNLADVSADLTARCTRSKAFPSGFNCGCKKCLTFLSRGGRCGSWITFPACIPIEAYVHFTLTWLQQTRSRITQLTVTIWVPQWIGWLWLLLWHKRWVVLSQALRSSKLSVLLILSLVNEVSKMKTKNFKSRNPHKDYCTFVIEVGWRNVLIGTLVKPLPSLFAIWSRSSYRETKCLERSTRASAGVRVHGYSSFSCSDFFYITLLQLYLLKYQHYTKLMYV